jgi:hypothetical protein
MDTTQKRDKKKMEKKSLFVLSISAIVLTLMIMSFASAEFWACFDKGEKAYYCNNYKPPRSCSSSTGCQWCMLSYDAADNCYIHGTWPRCNQLAPSCGSIGGGDGPGVDGVPPVLSLSQPTDGSLFETRKVLVEFSLDEEADVYYLDTVNGRGKWNKVCSNCDPGNPAFSKGVSFEEGQNIIQFKAVDPAGNEAVTGNINFFVDSKKPKIKKTLPKKGFANGEFWVNFQESNPAGLILYYGNNGSSQANVDLASCIPSGTSNDKQSCDISIDLSPYNGQEINYWFTLTDIVGNTASSKPINIEVDMTDPVVNNPGDFFHYETGTKYAYFHLNINEDNFDEVSYSYTDSKGKVKEKTICSRLKEGMCEKKLSFTKGEWHLTVSVVDEAGNAVALPADFTVDY